MCVGRACRLSAAQFFWFKKNGHPPPFPQIRTNMPVIRTNGWKGGHVKPAIRDDGLFVPVDSRPPRSRDVSFGIHAIDVTAMGTTFVASGIGGKAVMGGVMGVVAIAKDVVCKEHVDRVVDVAVTYAYVFLAAAIALYVMRCACWFRVMSTRRYADAIDGGRDPADAPALLGAPEVIIPASAPSAALQGQWDEGNGFGEDPLPDSLEALKCIYHEENPDCTPLGVKTKKKTWIAGIVQARTARARA